MGETSNFEDVNAIDHFEYDREIYVVASGDGDFEFFKLSDVKKQKFTSKLFLNWDLLSFL